MQSAAECVSLIKWTVARYRDIEEKRVVHRLNKYARISVIGQWQRQFPAACVGSMHLILFYTLLEMYNIYILNIVSIRETGRNGSTWIAH